MISKRFEFDLFIGSEIGAEDNSKRVEKRKVFVPDNWDAFYSQSDTWIRHGKIGEVRSQLLSIPLASIPRSKAERIAHLHNRVGLFLRGLEILWPVIHPEVATFDPANPDEKVTYAMILIKLGSYEEALKILDEVPHESRAGIARANCYQAGWRTNEAVPLLRQFIGSKGVDPYDAAVARVNLAAALITIRKTDEARAVIDALYLEAKQNRWTLLFKNLQELSGQLSIYTSNLKEAQEILKYASRERYIDDSVWDFLVTKWLAFVGIRIQAESKSAQSKIEKVASRARELGHWESLRECDYELALAKRDQDLLAKVYFGTPYAGFREGLIQDAESWLSGRPSRYIHGRRDGLIFDLRAGHAAGGELSIKPGQLMHRTFVALASDLYRPSFFGTLHSRIFPGDYFNPLTASQRVASAVQRLRRWFLDHNLPMSVESENNFYKLHLDMSGCKFGLLFNDSTLEPVRAGDLSSQLQVDRLRQAVGVQSFSAVEAAGFLKMSRPAAAKIITFGLHSGLLEKSGSARYTLYRFAA